MASPNSENPFKSAQSTAESLVQSILSLDSVTPCPELLSVGLQWQTALQGMHEFVTVQAPQCPRPAGPDDIIAFYYDVVGAVEQITETQYTFSGDSNAVDFSSHMQAVQDASSVFFWVTEDDPAQFIVDLRETVQLHCANAVAETIGIPTAYLHQDFTTALMDHLSALHVYVKENYPHGVRWLDGQGIGGEVEENKSEEPPIDDFDEEEEDEQEEGGEGGEEENEAEEKELLLPGEDVSSTPMANPTTNNNNHDQEQQLLYPSEGAVGIATERPVTTREELVLEDDDEDFNEEEEDDDNDNNKDDEKDEVHTDDEEDWYEDEPPQDTNKAPMPKKDPAELTMSPQNPFAHTLDSLEDNDEKENDDEQRNHIFSTHKRGKKDADADADDDDNYDDEIIPENEKARSELMAVLAMVPEDRGEERGKELESDFEPIPVSDTPRRSTVGGHTNVSGARTSGDTKPLSLPPARHLSSQSSSANSTTPNSNVAAGRLMRTQETGVFREHSFSNVNPNVEQSVSISQEEKPEIVVEDDYAPERDTTRSNGSRDNEPDKGKGEPGLAVTDHTAVSPWEISPTSAPLFVTETCPPHGSRPKHHRHKTYPKERAPSVEEVRLGEQEEAAEEEAEREAAAEASRRANSFKESSFGDLNVDVDVDVDVDVEEEEEEEVEVEPQPFDDVFSTRDALIQSIRLLDRVNPCPSLLTVGKQWESAVKGMHFFVAVQAPRRPRPDGPDDIIAFYYDVVNTVESSSQVSYSFDSAAAAAAMEAGNPSGRPTDYTNHMQAMQDATSAFFWVIEDDPVQFLSDLKASVRFHCDRALADTKAAPTAGLHQKFATALMRHLNALQRCIRENYPRGVRWLDGEGIGRGVEGKKAAEVNQSIEKEGERRWQQQLYQHQQQQQLLYPSEENTTMNAANSNETLQDASAATAEGVNASKEGEERSGDRTRPSQLTTAFGGVPNAVVSSVFANASRDDGAAAAPRKQRRWSSSLGPDVPPPILVATKEDEGLEGLDGHGNTSCDSPTNMPSPPASPSSIPHATLADVRESFDRLLIETCGAEASEVDTPLPFPLPQGHPSSAPSVGTDSTPGSNVGGSTSREYTPVVKDGARRVRRTLHEFCALLAYAATHTKPEDLRESENRGEDDNSECEVFSGLRRSVEEGKALFESARAEGMDETVADMVQCLHDLIVLFEWPLKRQDRHDPTGFFQQRQPVLEEGIKSLDLRSEQMRVFTSLVLKAGRHFTGYALSHYGHPMGDAATPHHTSSSESRGLVFLKDGVAPPPGVASPSSVLHRRRYLPPCVTSEDWQAVVAAAEATAVDEVVVLTQQLRNLALSHDTVLQFVREESNAFAYGSPHEIALYSSNSRSLKTPPVAGSPLTGEVRGAGGQTNVSVLDDVALQLQQYATRVILTKEHARMPARAVRCASEMFLWMGSTSATSSSVNANRTRTPFDVVTENFADADVFLQKIVAAATSLARSSITTVNDSTSNSRLYFPASPNPRNSSRAGLSNGGSPDYGVLGIPSSQSRQQSLGRWARTLRALLRKFMLFISLSYPRGAPWGEELICSLVPSEPAFTPNSTSNGVNVIGNTPYTIYNPHPQLIIPTTRRISDMYINTSVTASETAEP